MFGELLKGITDGIKDMVKSNTIYAHYGETEENSKRQYVGMFHDLLMSDRYSDAIDKHFKKLSAADRLKIFNFSLAFYHHQTIRRLSIELR